MANCPLFKKKCKGPNRELVINAGGNPESNSSGYLKYELCFCRGGTPGWEACEKYIEESKTDPTASSSTSESSKNGCYVATCVYGSYDCPEVLTLRRFRDNKLSKSWFGERFIKVYYKTGPIIVKLFGEKVWFNRVMKVILDKIVANV